jgi:hypothetical protein
MGKYMEILSVNLRDDANIWWNLRQYNKNDLSNEEYEKAFLNRWSHVVKKDKKSTRDLFSCVTSYYRFMEVFSKRRSLFLLTLVANIISSMLTWLKHCKFPHRIFKSHKMRVKMFKFLKI